MALRDVDLSRHFGVVDAAAALRFHPEVLTDLVHFDAARSVVLDDHRAAHISGVDAPGAIALDRERSGHVADVDVARPVVHLHIAADVFDREITRAVRDANRPRGADHGKRSRTVGRVQRADVRYCLLYTS